MVAAPTEAAEEDLDTDADIGRGDQEILQALRELPRPAVLAPLPGNPVPVVIDAWIALEALRAAASPGQKARDRQDIDETAIQRISEISLEHLLVGSPIMGDPADGGVGGITGNQNNSSNGSGPTITDSYQFSGGDTRTRWHFSSIRPRATRPSTVTTTTVGVRWSPSWIPVFGPIRGWKGSQTSPGATLTARTPTASSRSIPGSRTLSAGR